MFVLRLPVVAAMLIYTFKPEVTDMSRADRQASHPGFDAGAPARSARR